MGEKEYLATLTEQIQNKSAKELVEQEIRNHIEEQTLCYQDDGMDKEDAIREAVRQMGDPVETGKQLDQIHRPAFPWKMFLLAFALTSVSVLMQGIVLSQTSDLDNLAQGMMTCIVITIAGLVMITVIAITNYTFFFRHGKAFLIGYLAITLLFSGNYLIVTDYNQAILFQYSIYAFLPLFEAFVIYQNRNGGVKALLKCMAFPILLTIVLTIIFEVMGLSIKSGAGIIENMLVTCVLLIAVIQRGILGTEKKKYFIGMLCFAAGSLLIVTALLLWVFEGLGTYWIARLLNVSSQFLGENKSVETSYVNNMIHDYFSKMTLTGTRELSRLAVTSDNQGTYLLHQLCTYFGILSGAVVVAALLLFLWKSFGVSKKQSNRMGFLLSVACCTGMAVRTVSYFAINLGFAVWYTTDVPFLNYGILNTIVNAIYVGLLFSVARNTMVVGDTQINKKKISLSI